jgi:prolyl-tRNA synthetase
MARRAYCSCNKVEAVEESEKMMNVYADFAKTSAIPVVKVLKPKRSVLLAEETYCIEALMQESITSRNVPLFRSKFCKSFDVKFAMLKARICLGTLGCFNKINGCFSNDAF